MSNPRYTAVAAELKSRIIRRVCRRALPSVRDLAGEFGCARQTVGNAVNLLCRDGLVRPVPRSGIRIVPPRRRRLSVIGLVAQDAPQSLLDSADVRNLLADARPDGFLIEPVRFSERYFSPELAQRFGRRFAGLIFIYSTLTVEVANWLAERRTPFISGNRIPALPGINYVEHDNESALRSLARQLHERGYRRIGLFFPGALESYSELSMALWHRIKTEYGLPPLAVDRFRVDWSLSPELKLRHLERFLRQSRELPEAMIFWQDLPRGFRPLPGMLHLYAHRNGTPLLDGPEFVAFSPAAGNNRQLLRGLYEAMREMLWYPPPAPIHRAAPMELVTLQEIPPAGSLPGNC